ncbi:MAG TPA: tyrosine-type recombinase/integrase [Solirubrobacteraceae bacterium]|nr:tyrosine-type recombinase/integrase [Solirubrobacteraceae bacterium]
MATGCIRERNGRFYVRTRVLAVDPLTGVSRWRQVEKAAGHSRRRAERILRGLQEEVEDGRYVPASMSVLELGRKWLTEHVDPNLKPGAAANYRGTFYLHIAPTLGAVRVDDMRPQMIRALLSRKRGEGLSEQTVAKIRRHVHAMFAFAQDAGLVSINPADAARARGQKHSHRRARGTELSPAQVKRFLDACSTRWRLFFTVALDTGLRRGELIGLRWGDVDLLERILYVRRSIGAYDDPDGEDADELLSTKTEASQRLVPILDGAQRALERMYAGARDTSENAPVFITIERKPGRDGVVRPVGRPLSPRMVTRVFRRYAQRAGLPESIRLHDLRHTAITNAIGQGEDILLVSAFAGHAKTSTTVDVYGHLMPDRVREAAKRMHSISGPDTGAPPAEPGPSPLAPAPDPFAPAPDPVLPERDRAMFESDQAMSELEALLPEADPEPIIADADALLREAEQTTPAVASSIADLEALVRASDALSSDVNALVAGLGALAPASARTPGADTSGQRQLAASLQALASRPRALPADTPPAPEPSTLTMPSASAPAPAVAPTPQLPQAAPRPRAPRQVVNFNVSSQPTAIQYVFNVDRADTRGRTRARAH